MTITTLSITDAQIIAQLGYNTETISVTERTGTTVSGWAYFPNNTFDAFSVITLGDGSLSSCWGNGWISDPTTWE